MSIETATPTPAAPVAPTAAPAAAPAPEAPSPLRSVSAAIQAYRDGTLQVPSASDIPRRADGTFKRREDPALAEPAEPVAEADEPTPEEGDADAATAEPATEAEPTGEVVEEDEAGSEAAVEAPQSEAEDAFVFSLPGRHEGDPEEEVTLQGLTQPQRELFNMLKNGFLRRPEYERRLAEVERDRTELDGIEEALRADPAGFISRAVKKLPVREQVARDALLEILDEDSDEARAAYGRIVDALESWEHDPNARKLARYEREEQRRKIPERTVREAPRSPDPAPNDPVRAVVDRVLGLVPDHFSDPQSRAFQVDALTAVQKHLDRTGSEDLDLAQLPQILSATLAQYGIHAAAAPSARPASDGRSAPASSVPEPARRDPDVRDTGTQLAQASRRRKAAAAVTPAGAGAPAARLPKPPAGAGVREALQWYRNQR